MRIRSLTLKPYGECSDVTIEFGRGLTVVLGANEAGKSTALDALTDLLWGIPLNTSRASRVRRKDLRILAEVQTADGTSLLTRSPNGLFGADQFAPAVAPWDRAMSLDRSWWRTRFGISHEQLRDGGREVFQGRGDLAELVFAAREGASARALREDIAGQVDALFKAHKGNKNVALRKAAASYADADAQLRGVLTQADSVRAQERRGRLDRVRGAHGVEHRQLGVVVEAIAGLDLGGGGALGGHPIQVPVERRSQRAVGDRGSGGGDAGRDAAAGGVDLLVAGPL